MVSLEVFLKRLRSDSTRDSYKRCLLQFLAFHAVDWEESLTWSLEEAEDRIIDFRQSLIDEGKAGQTVRLALSAVKKWFWDNRIRVVVSAGVSLEKTYLDYIPDKTDLQHVLDSSRSPHVKMAIMLMAFAGFRPVDVVTLRYANVRASLEAGDEVLTIIKRHQKTRDWFPTFLGPQGTRYMREFFALRRRRGEKMTNDSFVVAWLGRGVTTDSITRAIRGTIERSIGRRPTGEPFRKFRPYGLRKYFRRAVSAMGDAEAELLMGHAKGIRSLEATYGGLRDMDPVAIAELKKKYIKILPDLETELTDASVRARIEHLEEKESEVDKMKREIAELRLLVETLRDSEEAEEAIDDLEPPP